MRLLGYHVEVPGAWRCADARGIGLYPPADKWPGLCGLIRSICMSKRPASIKRARALAAEAAHLEALIEMALARKDADHPQQQALARLDVAATLAERGGRRLGACFVEEQRLEIIGRRAPVVEAAAAPGWSALRRQ